MLKRVDRVPVGPTTNYNQKKGEANVKIIKMGVSIAAVSMAMFLGSASTVAQEAVTFGDDARYMRVVFVSYKPGKAGEAYGIINDHFAPAGAAAGLRGPIIIHFQSGAWDASFHWRLEDGLADLEWRISPNNVSFRAALVAQEGSEDAADAIFDRYNSLIARTSTVIGHRHVLEDEE